ncbi:uncharacterized protein LOC113869448 [Abrus precatorius]|uniref:Uncharacterized protein LOC113869448 n=1 Tax=Abrus precatorius TaxID=3816 RepID=A0A8B8LZ72_ABRPR|nr:uncharacterized protein LOC113869448 [Abrus precatorius]
MEETLVPKRPREEAQVEKNLDFVEGYSKRYKPYNHILSLLDLEEEDSTQDLSPLMTTLQQEITCASNNNPNTLLECAPLKNDQNSLTTTFACVDDTATSPTCFCTQQMLKEEEENDKESVMRHLLHASDDELGIPSSGDGLLGFEQEGFNSIDEFSSLCDKLWELEDERANYYALMQSELFLWGH